LTEQAPISSTANKLVSPEKTAVFLMLNRCDCMPTSQVGGNIGSFFKSLKKYSSLVNFRYVAITKSKKKLFSFEGE
jgi:hypothetical protein